ncbi:MAG TPA: glutamate synthase subunit beta [Chitinophagales bacterium]|nr:glutamate synthase subunit beta [Chitinophagales bacterium]HMU98396.1 glutamate synthase subunit beta [Chitinophagales bacterium]HMV02955.1 glutamate synthase subunit beta [Chitinophagales bacterium]HMW94962.1 glutamate synthase subunit beta [Chitinophagales bacterium]HMY43016.1 glutamate synthase subunit beta [Chitinophagales bacterium]
MGKITGFLEFNRELPKHKDPKERIHDYKEFYLPYPEEKTRNQAARCMDCGVPFCHNGCPLGNIIPEFNDAVYKGDWELAAETLLSTNNFPEFTGRICPAPCETACVLGINQPPVAIEYIEKSIIEKAFELGYVQPNIPTERTNKNIAIVGSGPAGLAAATQLNKAGHNVVVFERADRVGGLLRYGIPDFKLQKDVVERRIDLMEKEGVIFKTNTNIGVDITLNELQEKFDAVVLSGGSTVARDLPISGRELKGIYPAMEFLSQQNKRVAGIPTEIDHRGMPYLNGDLLATGKNVLVIGGGDTGSDCVGTSNRHGALSVTQIELLSKPPIERAESTPWPEWPMMLRTSSSHEEGCDRQWAILTKEFIGNENGELTGLKIVEIEWKEIEGKQQMSEIEGTERILPCELVLLAMGFVHPQHEGMLEQMPLEKDGRGNLKSKRYKTNIDKVFTAGDMRRGQSLVVWAISEGRECAREVDIFLMGESKLEAKDRGIFQVNK